ncbi:MAG: DUF4197 domain-containing protein [Burkholderiaceae bacterium]|nr:DUF4197 domain-containing protein [Sulfuritalea sp.]MCF8174972.1 DUF4197 domain-containing protein [Burkholderiaceae bacterium]MCF8183802.1 DUF4197 domain-containing protein [Polynucleobacter sp.]
MRLVLTFIAAVFFATSAHAFSLDDISVRDADRGLKEALTQGAGKAVALLGKQDGFLGNPKVMIPLPESVQKIEGLLRGFGMNQQADELITAMNRAAEAAVPQAKALLVNSIKSMSVADAKGILSGGEDSATQYFRRTTSEPLAAKFKPVVRKAIARVKLAEKYDQLAGKAAKFGLVREQDAHLEDYVTRKALDGLYLMIAEEEKAIRQNPAEAAGRLAQKVFGALR